MIRRWSPAPVPRASLWLHGIGAAALAVQPQFWPQVLGLLAANHLLLMGLMHPRGQHLGPNRLRLPEGMARSVALTFDDGPDPDVTPRVLDMLDRHQAKASFFVIGQRARQHPALVRDILARGHGIGNHTQTHPASFALRGPWALRREVAEAQRTIADITGLAPRFFRAPMGLRSPLLDPVLAAEDLQLVAWARRGYDTRLGPEEVLRRLTRGLAGRDILLLHDGATFGPRERARTVLSVLPPLLDRLAEAGLSSVAVTGDAGAR